MYIFALHASLVEHLYLFPASFLITMGKPCGINLILAVYFQLWVTGSVAIHPGYSPSSTLFPTFFTTFLLYSTNVPVFFLIRQKKEIQPKTVTLVVGASAWYLGVLHLTWEKERCHFHDHISRTSIRAPTVSCLKGKWWIFLLWMSF